MDIIKFMAVINKNIFKLFIVVFVISTIVILINIYSEGIKEYLRILFDSPKCFHYIKLMISEYFKMLKIHTLDIIPEFY